MAQGRSARTGPDAFPTLIASIAAHSARISPKTVWTFVSACDDADLAKLAALAVDPLPARSPA